MKLIGVGYRRAIRSSPATSLTCRTSFLVASLSHKGAMWSVLFVFIFNAVIATNYALCADERIDWVVSYGSTDPIRRSAANAVKEFFGRILKTGKLGDHYLTIISYADAENGCLDYALNPTSLKSGKLYKENTFLSKLRGIQDWKMAGFDSWVRALLLTNRDGRLRPDSKKIILYFYDAPSLLSKSCSLHEKSLANKNDYCRGNNYVTYDLIQEVVQQNDVTVIAIKIPSNNIEENDKHVREEDAQMKELQRRGLKLKNLIYPRFVLPSDVADGIFQALSDECTSPAQSTADQLLLMEVLQNCIDPITWVIVYPTTEIGIGWAQSFARSITQLARDLQTADHWQIAAFTYTDKPDGKFGNSNFAKCASVTLGYTDIREFNPASLRRKIIYDKGDVPNAALDGLIRAVSYRKPRFYSRRLILYVHTGASHAEGDTKWPKIGADDDLLWNNITYDDINSHCNTHDYVSPSTVGYLIPAKDVLINVNIAYSDELIDETEWNQYLELKKYVSNINRLDIGHFPGKSSYYELLRAIIPFCKA